MYSYIVTVGQVYSDGVKFVETGAILAKEPFPALNDAKPGDKYKLFTKVKSNNYGVGYPTIKVEKVDP
jgi:hypothetical protein